MSIWSTGLLASVEHLKTINITRSIIVSWSAPLNLCDIRYTVLIYNVTHKDNHTAIPCTDCHNLTQTHYIFSPDYPSPCHQYTFTVIPFNGAGQGESSQNVTGHTIVDSEFIMYIPFYNFCHRSRQELEGKWAWFLKAKQFLYSNTHVCQLIDNKQVLSHDSYTQLLGLVLLLSLHACDNYFNTGLQANFICLSK